MEHSYLEILILSFIQGITEFLPISSSGHLIIAPKLFGWQDQGLEMDVAVHLGTLMSVLVYFYRDLCQMIGQFFQYVFGVVQGKGTSFTPFPHAKLGFVIILATIPAVICGFVLKKMGGEDLRQVWIVGTTSIVFGILLYVADRAAQRYSLAHIGFGRGFLIGCAQAVALIPGTSRSGICISMARFLKIHRSEGTRFAFLLSIPAIMGAGVLTMLDAMKRGHAVFTDVFLVAILASFLFGLLAIHFMIRYVSRHGLGIFMIYRILLGTILLVFYT